MKVMTMSESEKSFFPKEQPFQYLRELLDTGNQKMVDTEKYIFWIYRLMYSETPEAVEVAIREKNGHRLLEAYHLDLEGVKQVQCQIPPLVDIPLKDESKTQMFIHDLSGDFAFERATKVAEFVERELNDS